MASGRWRALSVEEMEMAGASAALSTSSYGNPSMKKSSAKDISQNENGPKRSQTDQEDQAASEDGQHPDFHEEMARYVQENFHQKECIMFIPNRSPKVEMNSKLVCKCGEVLSSHWGHRTGEPIEQYVHEDFVHLARSPTEKPPDEIAKVPWSQKNHLKKTSTWTYGEMTFNVESAGGRKPAKYLRLSNEDSVDACLEFMEKYWHIMEPHPPNLVISVVGGAKNFRLDGEMLDTFSRGLIKAAKTTNAWLITSGFNTGVMKIVGQAVQQGQAFQWDNDRVTHLLRCIAIAPWGYVYNRHCLEKDRKGEKTAYYRASNAFLYGKPVSLNPDHTHFIFVDDGMRNRYGGVTDFRAEFERKLRTPKSGTEKGYGIPVVLVVVEGGHGAILDACKALEKGIPVVVCTGTGRAADILTYAHKFTFKDKTGQPTMNERQRKTLEDRVEQAYGKKQLETIMDNIYQCMQKDNLITFFDLQREDDLDVAILSALTKVKTSPWTMCRQEQLQMKQQRLKQLELALTWNRADIAQTEIFRDNIIWNPNELYDIMTKALMEDKVTFVRLLLNQGVSMKEYLTVPRLQHLYNSLPEDGFLHKILTLELKKQQFTMQDIGKFLKNMLDHFDNDMFTSPANKKDQPHSTGSSRGTDTTDTVAEEESARIGRGIDTGVEKKAPYQQLLIWAVLLNRPELARFFWEVGEEPITSALSASLLCHRMYQLLPKYLHSQCQDILIMRKMFEELATKVLDECHAKDPEKAMNLVERESPSWSCMTCMQIAASAKSKRFMSSMACEKSVNKVWKSGVLADWRKVAIAALLPFLIIPMIQIHKGKTVVSHCQKILIFLTAPVTKFFYYMISYFIFLACYTYMLLMDFQKDPSLMEYLLVFWIITIFLGEVYTFIVLSSFMFFGKKRDWMTFLIQLDMANFLLAIIGFVLHCSTDYYMEAKIVYCVNAVIFYIRIMKLYIPSSRLGPKVYMIMKMVEELAMFIMVFLVFLLAYGVCSQGLLYKKRQASFLQVVKDIIQFPYWHLYGEIALEEIQTDTGCLEHLHNGTEIPPYENACRESYWLVYIMLGLYLLVGNVLLLNLLIAIFSNVFKRVESNTIEIWKYQMYFLVMEFQSRVCMPPPLSILQHIYYFPRFICLKKKKQSFPSDQHRIDYLNLFEKEMMGNYLQKLKFESLDTMERKFIKLQKRMDTLNKIIEDKLVELELDKDKDMEEKREGQGAKKVEEKEEKKSETEKEEKKREEEEKRETEEQKSETEKRETEKEEKRETEKEEKRETEKEEEKRETEDEEEKRDTEKESKRDTEKEKKKRETENEEKRRETEDEEKRDTEKEKKREMEKRETEKEEKKREMEKKRETEKEETKRETEREEKKREEGKKRETENKREMDEEKGGTGWKKTQAPSLAEGAQVDHADMEFDAWHSPKKPKFGPS